MLADVATTAHILAAGGVELNPLARVWLALGGIDALLIQKAVALVVVLSATWAGWRYAARRGYGRAAARVYQTTFYTLAAVPVVWNLCQIAGVPV